MHVGVIGLGSIGMRHARNAISLGHKVFGFDPDEARQSLLVSHGGTAASRDSAFACDRLVVASPTPHHLEDIKASKNPTLVEKPIADVPIDEVNLGHITLVGYNLRYHSCVKQAREWIRGGFIGIPLCGHFMLAQFNNKPAYLRDGVVLNWSHEIDLCLHLMGPGTCLASACKNNTVADFFIQHKSGAVSSIHLNYLNKSEERYFTILGDKGKIHCVLAPYRIAECYQEDKTIMSYKYDTTFDEDYITEMKAFLSGDIGPGCTAKEAKEVLTICLGL